MAKSLIVICDNCNASFRQPIAWYKRSKTHCCNKKCADELKHKNNTSICVFCKNIFQNRRHKHKNKYCSSECRGKANRRKDYTLNSPIPKPRVLEKCATCGKNILIIETKIKKNKFFYCNRQCWKNKPHSINLKTWKRQRGYCKELMENAKCNCGINKKYLLHIHHIDGNHDNNKLSNLEIVCANCHIKRHMNFINGKWKFCTKSLTPREILNCI